MTTETKTKITYEIIAEPEWEPIEGNAIASGDYAYDRKVANKIRGDLESGNVWAWCAVTVRASLPGCPVIGEDYLGCCSYRDEADFRQPGGYYEDMCAIAKQRLIENLRHSLDSTIEALIGCIE